jgi:hypothetical protein
MSTNKQMHRTAAPRCSFRVAGLFGSWIRSQSPFPAAVGDLDRYAEKRKATALKKCKECGNDVRTKATAGPKCGAVLIKKTGCLGYAGVVGVAAGCLLALT